MVKDYSKKYKTKSRLRRVEEKQSLKQAFLFSFLTIVLIIVLIIFGIPALIKLAVFLGEIKSSKQTPEISDTLAPPTPILNSLTEATSSSQIKVSGFGQEGTTIKLVLNNETIKEAVVAKDGSFVFASISLKSGENEIKAKAVDDAANESAFSQKYTVVFDNQAPELIIDSPKEGDEFFDKDKEIVVQGLTDENITVYVNDRFSLSDSSAKFSTQIELKEGENEIIVKAIDKAGNQTIKELKVSYTP